MATATLTPEEELSILEERRTELQARLDELIPIRGEEYTELLRAVAYGAPECELAERRSTAAELMTEIEESEGALQVVNQNIEAVALIVNEREKERKIALAAEKTAALRELARKLTDTVTTFAREQWGPLYREALIAQNEAIEAETESRRAQGMHREDIYRAQFEIGYPGSGNRDLDAYLDYLAFPPPPPENPNLP